MSIADDASRGGPSMPPQALVTIATHHILVASPPRVIKETVLAVQASAVQEITTNSPGAHPLHDSVVALMYRDVIPGPECGQHALHVAPFT